MTSKSGKKGYTISSLLELTLAAVFWGFGFVATIWALRFLSPPAVIAYRFILAFAGGAIILVLKQMPLQEVLKEAKAAFLGGFLLFLTLILQTVGLLFTTATKSAFITTTYVLIVPLVSRLLFKNRLPPRHWFWVTLALLGTALIVNIQKDRLTYGDLFTIACAVAASLHILYVDRISSLSASPFTFNVMQSFWAALFGVTLFPFSQNWKFTSMDKAGWAGLLSLAFGSSLLGFFLQVRAQKRIPPALAAILFLLESPFSYLFAFILLGERLSLLQLGGAILIVFACAGASLGPRSS